MPLPNISLVYWKTALAGLLLQALGMGLIGVYGFFVNPVAETFGKDFATVNLGLALLLLLSAIASPLVGAVIDRSPLRPVLMLGAVLAGSGLTLVSQADEFGNLVIGFIVFSLGVVCYGPLVCNLLIVRAYSADRARALAVAAIGVSVASVVLPLLTAELLDRYAWRSSLMVLGCGVAFGVFVTALFVVKEPPRQVPVATARQDNPPDNSAGTEQSQKGPTHFSKNPNFWLMGLVTALVMSAMSLITVVMVPHFLSIDLSRQTAAGLMASMGVAGLIGKLCLAIVSDRVQPVIRRLAGALALAQMLAWLVLATNTDIAVLYGCMLLMGFTNGLFIPLIPYINSVYFRETELGRISGLHMAIMLPFSLLGPWLAGRHFDLSGSYVGVFYVLSAALALVLVSLFLMRSGRSSR